MAHFAVVDENNIVQEVIVISNQDILDENGNESEALGVEKCREVKGTGFNENYKYLQCSYNSNMRGKFPGIGFTYDEEMDVFIPAKPCDSWVLNDELTWEPPNKPEQTEQNKLDNVSYIWDCFNEQWIPYLPRESWNPPELSEDEVETHYYDWDYTLYQNGNSVHSCYVKREFPSLPTEPPA